MCDIPLSIIRFPYRKKNWIEASLSAVRIRINFNQSCTFFKADMSIEILNSITCIVLHSEPIEWTTISSWYLGSSNPLYFDMLCRHSKPHRFKLIVESDLSEDSLHVINTSEPTPHNFDDVYFQSYRICEDTLVSCWTKVNDPDHRSPSAFNLNALILSVWCIYGIINIRSSCQPHLAWAAWRSSSQDVITLHWA